MNILVDELRISGFRGISDIEIKLQRVTVLVGTNNSGKTSILRALHLAFGDYARYLTEEDFHIGEDQKRVAEIQIDARIIPIDDDEKRAMQFSEAWQTKFEDSIKAESNNYQYVALRTRIKPNSIKGGYDTSRLFLDKWPDVKKGINIKESKVSLLKNCVILILRIFLQKLLKCLKKYG